MARAKVLSLAGSELERVLWQRIDDLEMYAMVAAAGCLERKP